MSDAPFPKILSRLRTESGFTFETLAIASGVSKSSISRWENDQNHPKRRGDVERLDAALAANGQLLRAWTARASGGSTLPPWMRVAARLEEEAIAIDYISPLLVPGVLQCPEYAERVFREGQPLASDSEISQLVAVRCDRYEKMSAKISAVFPKAALTSFPEEICREQAKHLRALIEGGRLRVCFVPDGVMLIGITSPMLMARLANGGRAAASDHLSGNVIHDHADDWDWLSELSKRAYSTAAPAWQAKEILEDLGA